MNNNAANSSVSERNIDQAYQNDPRLGEVNLEINQGIEDQKSAKILSDELNKDVEQKVPTANLPVANHYTENTDILFSQPGYLRTVEVTEMADYLNLPKEFTWGSIPMFSVITGKNGVGKSALLNAVLYGAFENQEQIKLTFLDQEKPQFCSLKNTEEIKSLRHDLDTTAKKEFENERKKLFDEQKRYALNRLLGNKNNQPQDSSQTDLYDEIIDATLKLYNQKENTFSFLGFENELETQFNKRQAPHIADYSSLPELTKRIFNNLMEKALDKVDKKTAAKEAFTQINQHLINYKFKYILSEKSFAWNINNGQFDRIKLTFANPSQVELSNSSREVDYGNLSSGERLVLLVLLWQFEQRNNSKRGIILLDEPDAHLNPSLVKEIIDMIKTKLVKELGLQVIMTTHNPTTISFVPAECLFVLENEPPKFKPIIHPVKNKLEAINILSGNLVYVNEPFAVAFVEGDKDKQFYNLAAKRLNDTGKISMQIVFKVHGTGTKPALSGCSEVKSLVEKMTEADKIEPLSQFVFGLIDGDNNKSPELKNLKALKRYSIENYIFDPIHLFLCLHYIYMQYKTTPDSMLDLKDCATYFEKIATTLQVINEPLGKILQQEFLQSIVNYFSNVIRDELKKALSFRESNYQALINIIQKEIDSLNALLNDTGNVALIQNIIKKPGKINAVLREHFAALQQTLEQEIDKTNCDIFNLTQVLVFDEKEQAFNPIKHIALNHSNSNRTKEIADIILKYFNQLKETAENKQTKDWADLKNALGGRHVKIMDTSGQVDWESTENEVIHLLLKDKSNTELTLTYPKLLLYFRGHNLQTCYEKIFKIPHELAHEFTYILDTIGNILIPDDLMQIYTSMKSVIEEKEVQSKEEKIYSNSGNIPFFKKKFDKIEQARKYQANLSKQAEPVDDTSSDEEGFSTSIFAMDNL
jgi:predicted ATPase